MKKLVAVLIAICMILILTSCNDTVLGKEVKDIKRFVKLEGYEYYLNDNLVFVFEDTVTGCLYLIGSYASTPLLYQDGKIITREEFIAQEKERLGIAK